MELIIFNNHGILVEKVKFVRVYSGGLSCNLDHWHHPYWRFHFDLDAERTGELAGKQTEQVNLFNGTQLVGVQHQERELKNEQVGRAPSYVVENLTTKGKAKIIPSAIDPDHGIVPSTDFAQWDAVVRKYRAEEDKGWHVSFASTLPIPAFKNSPEIHFGIHENCDSTDIVFWSICHLFHRFAEPQGSKKHRFMHAIGPEIELDLPREPLLQPFEFRRVSFSGKIHFKDFKMFKKDKWGHFDLKKDEATRSINPLARHAEVIKQYGVGNVHVDLILRLDCRQGGSVGFDYQFKLFDEADLEDDKEGHYEIYINESELGVVEHLENDDILNPDAADIQLTVTNEQE